MCILLCFGPTPPRVTISCHPKFGAAEPRIRAQPKPDIPGPTSGMWGNSNGPGIPSERTGQIQRPLPLIAAFQSASRGCPSPIPGAWGPLRCPTARRGPATAFLATGRPGYGSFWRRIFWLKHLEDDGAARGAAGDGPQAADAAAHRRAGQYSHRRKDARRLRLVDLFLVVGDAVVAAHQRAPA